MPLLPILTAKYMSGGNDHDKACHKLSRFLAASYAAMESNSVGEMSKWGQKVAGQYIALEREALRHNADTWEWRIAPELHQYLHFTECLYPIQDFWCYADETAGGLLAKLYKKKGWKRIAWHPMCPDAGKVAASNNISQCIQSWQPERVLIVACQG